MGDYTLEKGIDGLHDRPYLLIPDEMLQLIGGRGVYNDTLVLFYHFWKRDSGKANHPAKYLRHSADKTQLHNLYGDCEMSFKNTHCNLI